MDDMNTTRNVRTPYSFKLGACVGLPHGGKGYVVGYSDMRCEPTADVPGLPPAFYVAVRRVGEGPDGVAFEPTYERPGQLRRIASKASR